ncbi:MAG: FecR family protein [Blastocatellia bacterium]
MAILQVYRRRILSRSLITILWALLVPSVSLAQSWQITVNVASVSGRVSIISQRQGGGAPLPLRKGDRPLPGDVIDTRLGGRAVLAFSDGSQVIIYPGSRVALKDLRSAGTTRELLDIISGRVRCKIYHFGGRPNPNRVNSPVASIAVRGTDFVVKVESSGETTVIVYEGLVEVSSRVNPQQRTLVEPGRSVIVRPGGDLVSLTTGAGSELNGLAKSPYDIGPPTTGVTQSYLNLVNLLMAPSGQPAPAQFVAFSDSHFDSLENPAYATEFSRAEGRVYLWPSVNSPRRFAGERAQAPIGSPHPLDMTMTSQATFFLPAGKNVFGGGAVMTRGNQEGVETAVYGEDTAGNAATKATTFDWALVAARRFGAESRASLGFKFESLTSKPSFDVAFNALGFGFGAAAVRGESQTEINRMRFTAGLLRDLGGGRGIGVYYRYSTAELSEESYDTMPNGIISPLGSAQRSHNNSSEVGWLFRGALTPRLFYGVKGSFIRERIETRKDLPQLDSSFTLTDEKAHRTAFGGGIGYALRPRTVLSLDIAGGTARARVGGQSIPQSNQSPSPGREAAAPMDTSFLTAHAAAQTDLRRRFLAQASFLVVKQWAEPGQPAARFQPNYSFFRRFYSPLGYIDYGRPLYLSNFGAGWRLKPDWLLQYILSTDYGRSAPSHTLMLRYNFSFGEKKDK